jgi:hypothetical protein
MGKHLSPWRGYFKGATLPESVKPDISAAMLLHRGKKPLNVFVAAIAVLFLTLAGVGEHAPTLHSTVAAVGAESHVHDHSHSHDDLEVVDVSSDDLSDQSELPFHASIRRRKRASETSCPVLAVGFERPSVGRHPTYCSGNRGHITSFLSMRSNQAGLMLSRASQAPD